MTIYVIVYRQIHDVWNDWVDTQAFVNKENANRRLDELKSKRLIGKIKRIKIQDWEG